MTTNDSRVGTNLIVFLSVLLVCGAATYRGGNRWLPIILLEWLGIVLLLLMFWFWRPEQYERKRNGLFKFSGRTLGLTLVLSSPILIAILQLLPLPSWWVRSEAIVLANEASRNTPIQAMLSVLPFETVQAALAGLPIVCCFALALYLPSIDVKFLLRIWVFTAVVQAALGLAQLVMPELSFSERPIYDSQGSFGSRNSFANYLAMLLPLVLLWTMQGSENTRNESRRSNRLLWASVLLLPLAALVASSSRAGIATGLLVLLLAWALLSEPRASSRSSKPWAFWLLRLAPLLLLAFAMAAGGWDWLKRYEAGDPSRLLNWAATWQAAQFYWPFGSGLGTFASVFPTFQPPELGVWFVNFAHNDYLQLLMEAGLLALPLCALVVGLVLHRCHQLARVRRYAPWSSNDAMAVACGLGFLAQALHAWVDYPWRIPATAMLGAFLLGVFLRDAQNRPHAASET